MGTTARAVGPAGPPEDGDDPLALVASPAWEPTGPLTVRDARRVFDRVERFTIGIEEELLLVEPGSLDLLPCVDAVIARLDGDPRFEPELRPSQIEIVTPVARSAADACRALTRARHDLVTAADGIAHVMAAGTHPRSESWGDVTAGDRYRAIADEYTWAAQRSLACGLHVHVAVGGADEALAVHNAARSFLPEIAALAANSPFFEGRDSGMCSIRPKLNEAFPRSGVPPAFAGWDELAGFVRWGRRGGVFPDGSHFWWDLRLHLMHGTLELRVADAQTRVDDATGIAALFHALVVWLTELHDAGERLPCHPSYRIRENAWRAHRYGVRGWLTDLDTGEPVPTRDRISRLLDELEPVGTRFGAEDELQHARTLLAGNGAERQRYVERREGMQGLLRWLVDETERPTP